jgi:hypothetical protein
MSWKNDFSAWTEELSVAVHELRAHVQHLEDVLQVEVARIATKIGESQDAYRQMADRLVSMAMVQRGDTKSAAIYRSQERLENTTGEKDDWDEPEGEDEWPPPGHTRVDRF